MEMVIVERRFKEPLAGKQLQRVARRARWCMDLYDVRFLCSYLSADGCRTICVFQAPDAEAVRHANRQAGLAFERVWTATLHEAEIPAASP